MMKFINVKCEVCGSEAGDTLFSVKSYGDIYRIFKCRHCGHLFNNPRPSDEDIRNFYKNLPWISNVRNNERLLFRQGLRILKRHVPRNGTLLDVGSGGGFLKMASNAGFQAVGVEPSTKSCEYAIKTYGMVHSYGNRLQRT